VPDAEDGTVERSGSTFRVRAPNGHSYDQAGKYTITVTIITSSTRLSAPQSNAQPISRMPNHTLTFHLLQNPNARMSLLIRDIKQR